MGNCILECGNLGSKIASLEQSSMIRYLTNATPDVSDIPGTTLVPHLGHIPYRDGVKVSVADLPGIEPRDIPYYFNTSARAGRFLQHCARCSAQGSKSLARII